MVLLILLYRLLYSLIHTVSKLVVKLVFIHIDTFPVPPQKKIKGGIVIIEREEGEGKKRVKCVYVLSKCSERSKSGSMAPSAASPFKLKA